MADPAVGGENDLPVLATLDDVVDLVGSGQLPVFVRWSQGPGRDLPEECSVDGLSGLAMPGLSVTSLAPEPWWQHRPVQLWVARRVHAYSPQRRQPGSGHGWLLTGEVVGRGPDHEPLVRGCRALAWLDDAVLDEAAGLVREAWDRAAG